MLNVWPVLVSVLDCSCLTRMLVQPAYVSQRPGFFHSFYIRLALWDISFRTSNGTSAECMIFGSLLIVYPGRFLFGIS